MNDVNMKLYQLVESLVRDNMHQKYKDDYNSFMIENGMLILFVEQNKNVIVNENVRKAIIQLITNEEYLSIVDKIRKELVPDNLVTIQQDNTPEENKESNNISFIPLDDAQMLIKTSRDQEIYNLAIKLAISSEYTHNLFIGVKDNHLEPVVKDINDNKWKIDEDNNELIDSEKGKVKKMKLAQTNSNKGFSNALILAFIIGSFIGIIFLNIYSKFMK